MTDRATARDAATSKTTSGGWWISPVSSALVLLNLEQNVARWEVGSWAECLV